MLRCGALGPAAYRPLQNHEPIAGTFDGDSGRIDHRQTVEHVLDLPADVEDQTPPGHDDLVRDAANPAHASRELCGAQSLVLPVDLAHETRPSAGDHYPNPLTDRRQVAANGGEQCVHSLCIRLPTEKGLTHVEVIADIEDTVD